MAADGKVAERDAWQQAVNWVAKPRLTPTGSLAYDGTMTVTLIRTAAIIVACVVVFLTLGPVGIRAMSPIAAQYDRALAYALVGFLAVLSAPRRPWLGAILVVVMAVVLEIAQRFTPDRHGRLLDTLEKLAGATVGIAAAYALISLTRKLRSIMQ